jgi:hypothetical protein
MVNVHDVASRAELARRIALLGHGSVDDGTAWRHLTPGERDGYNAFVIPDGVLDQAEAAAIGIHREDQIYGGVSPYRFLATKIITHGLFADGAGAPVGWSNALTRALHDSVLDGFSVFSMADAHAAGRLLLAGGPVRLKDVHATAGRGQTKVSTVAELDAALADRDPLEIAASGLVIEEHLEEVETFSVGRVSLFGQSIAYWGTQRLTMNNHGETVYGGSQLHAVRGGFDALASQRLAPEIAEAVAKAVAYDRAIFSAYPSLIASRRNYDVALGRNGRGMQRIGVLEQSWRPGGASGAEIAAFEAFERDPDLATITCATMEVYGDADAAPAHATLYFGGIDPVVGPLTKYTITS